MGINQALLKKIAEAKTNAGGNIIKEGKYLLEIEKIILEQMNSGMCFIVEFHVLEAMKINPAVEPNAIGSKCSMVVNLDGAGKLSAPGNIKSFTLALLGFTEDPAKVTPTCQLATVPEIMETVDELCAESNPGKGMLIAGETFSKLTRTEKKPFVGVNWSRVNQTADEIAKRRAAQEARATVAA